MHIHCAFRLGSLLLAAAVSMTQVVHVARAEEPASRAGGIELPPDPAERVSVRGVDVELHLPIPIYARPLCPEGSACILGVGGGFGVFVERRFQNGFAIGGGYSASILAAQSVYELTTLQSLGARARWVLLPESATHPLFDVGLGLATLGDVFRPATGGAYVDIGAGGEFEITARVAFTLGLSFRTVALAPFTTPQDHVRRSLAPYFDVITSLHVGVAWLAPRVRAR